MSRFIIAACALASALFMGGMNMGHAANLAPEQEAIIPIAAFTANGDEQRLEQALALGLDKGLTVNQIKEILVQMYAYCGFPRSLNGLAAFMALLDKRKGAGIQDPLGEAPKELPANADRNAMGTKIQTELAGAPVKGRLFEFSPAIDAFLKEHLFCDIFARGVLTNQERELATIAALAALPAPAQLAAHLNISMNTGLTEGQLRDYIAVLNDKVGKKEADTAERTLNDILAKRK